VSSLLRVVRHVGALAAVALACGPIAAPPGSGAPVNACPSHPCSDYPQSASGPNCTNGVCLTSAVVGHWTLVISIAQDAYYAPGATYAVSMNQLVNSAPPPMVQATCPAGTCAALPPAELQVVGDVVVSPSAAISAKWNLGNTVNTVLPVEAQFWPRWQESSSGLVDATALDLPLPPVDATNVEEALPPYPGPGGGPSLEFQQAALAPLVYQRILTPLPPFDQAYPPDVQDIDPSNAPLGGQVIIDGFDTTAITGSRTLPTFALSRADGQPLDGWTAWLRDQTTLRRISNLARLGGTMATGVQLLTKHVASASVDALANTQLIMSPPVGAPLPVGVFTPEQQEQYPRLPPSTTATGTILSQAHTPVPADLVFEATAICRFTLGGTVADLDPTGDLSFSTHVSSPDGAYSVTLPLGQYRLTVIPHDTSEALTLESFDLAIGEGDGGEQICEPVPAPEVAIDTQRKVTGKALVADGRPLADATVDVVPAQCSSLPTEPTCLPRSAQVSTAADGSFSMHLDQGFYLLRVRPAAGTNLPWMVQPLSVGPASTTAAPVTLVPAPVYAGLKLVDPGGNPVVEAVVRVFETPATGNPFEIGEAITDSNGHFDMYLDPGQQ
jgi:hypothetical protein